MLTYENEVKNGEKSILQLSRKELEHLKNLLTTTDDRERLKAQIQIEKLLSPYVDVFSYDVFNPPWLYNSCYQDNIWYIKSLKNIKEINFERIYLDKNKKLTDIPELVHIFKLWLSIATSPKYNSGTILKPNSVLQIVNRILTLIDAILLDSEILNLSDRKISVLNTNYFTDKLIEISTNGVELGVYNYIKVVREYLINAIKSISDKDLDEFEEEFPYITIECDNILELETIQIRKAKAYLYRNNAYKVATSKKISVNSDYFHKLYKNTFAFKNMKFPLLEELVLESLNVKKEYLSIPTKSQNANLSSTSIDKYIQSIEFLNIAVLYLNDFGLPIEIPLVKISKASILNHVENFGIGRYTTLPAKVVFKAFQNAFDYLIENQDHILESYFNLLLFYQKNNNIDQDLVKNIKEGKFLDCLVDETKKSGICRWNIDRDINFFSNLRKHSSFSHAYYLMTASLSIVIGTVMARRQSEIIGLDPVDSLIPSNMSPEENPHLEFYLKIKNSKSGIGGKDNIKENLSFPIPRSIANFIYKLQIFNEKLIVNNIVKKSEITLLTTFNKHNLLIRSMNQTTYNYYLDYFCDFFETPVITFTNDIKRRFYIRQHQLRRFFSMLFFWSKSFDGLDSLRSFLGHTHTEHLYHYITESTPGEVLYGVKARYIFENMNLDKNHQLYIENIENIEPILKKYFDVSSFDYLPEKEALDIYSDQVDQDYLQSIKSLEEQVFILLSKHIIDLKPHFFTVEDSLSGKKRRDYKLVLVVNE